ncbi:discoidin domain-containing protein [Niastella caeni]|uniref:Discoidin domain-containing protein n=1 Tax=Niastella caeni TaxID=2569763 RepID=A0A4S8HYX9_9BACT|nr:discoidin domain-containing protein [Niastella caeni]THU40745.1 discoidin domain-containing protein [Niastella caeni]
MKNIYYRSFRTACITALLYITGTNLASAQSTIDHSKAEYIPNNVGKIIPNVSYADPRQKTRYVYETNNNNTRLPEAVALNELYITPSNDGIVLRWRTTWEPDNLKLYEIEYSSDGINFQQVGVVAAGNYLNGKAYEFRHYPVNARDRMFYRIRITDKNGRYHYSQMLSLAATSPTQNYVFPTVVNAGMVSVYLNDSFKMLQIVNSQGQILQAQMLNGRTGRIDIPLNASAEGICFVRVLGQDRQRDIVQKIFIR